MEWDSIFDGNKANAFSQPLTAESFVTQSSAPRAHPFRTSNCNDCIFKVWARGIDGRFLTVPVVIDGRRK